MKKLVLVALLVSSVAFGLDKLGTIYVTDGGTSNNVVTTVRDAGRQADGGIISDGGSTDFLWAGAGFTVKVGTYPVVECRQDCHVNTDVYGCDAGMCPRIYGESLMQPYVAHSKSLTYTRYTGVVQSDGGLAATTSFYSGGFIAVSPADGGAACTCEVWADPVPR